MNKKSLFLMLLPALMVFMFASCSSEDGLTSGEGKTYRPYRSNINASSSLINVTGDAATKAVDGDFDRAGLYTVKDDGSVEAVAIVFTEDEEGNREEHPETLTVKPAKLISVGKNFVVMYACTYYDKDGDVFEMNITRNHEDDNHWEATVINSVLLLNKRTNKLYSLDVDFSEFADFVRQPENAVFEESENSLLVYSAYGNHDLYRISFSGNNVVVEKINNGGKGFADTWSSSETIVFTRPDGTVFSQSQFPGALSVLYPNKGYDLIERDCILTDNEVLTVNTADNGQYVLTLGCLDISQGNPTIETPLPGAVDIEYGASYNGYCYGSTNVVLNQGIDYIVYNRNTETLSKTHSDMNITLSPCHMFNGRCWDVKYNGSMLDKIVWLNPDTLEFGQLDTDVPGMDVDRISTDYVSGVIVIYGILRSNGSNCVVTVDLKTGESEVVATAPVGFRIELAPLN